MSLCDGVTAPGRPLHQSIGSISPVPPASSSNPQPATRFPPQAHRPRTTGQSGPSRREGGELAADVGQAGFGEDGFEHDLAVGGFGFGGDGAPGIGHQGMAVADKAGFRVRAAEAGAEQVGRGAMHPATEGSGGRACVGKLWLAERPVEDRRGDDDAE